MNTIPIVPLHYTANEREREIAILRDAFLGARDFRHRARILERLRELGVGVPASGNEQPPLDAA